MPDCSPKPGESKQDFVSRCIPLALKEGDTKEEAAGKCYGIYDNAKKSVTKAKQKTVRGYLAPPPGDISDKENDILAEVYATAREDGKSKEDAAKIAWGAVNRYRKKTKSMVNKMLNAVLGFLIGRTIK